MMTLEILNALQEDIHSVVFATVDDQGLPQTCVIDLMLADEDGLFFLTARGKSFYERLMARPFVSLSGLKGGDTLSSISISVRGHVRSIGQNRLEEIFEKNPYMAKLYPTAQSREALEVFQIYQGEGEYFNLSRQPPFRWSFSFGGAKTTQTGYRINQDACVGCLICRSSCPTSCISSSIPRTIDESHCLHCGNCFRRCPVKAVEKVESV